MNGRLLQVRDVVCRELEKSIQNLLVQLRTDNGAASSALLLIVTYAFCPAPQVPVMTRARWVWVVGWDLAGDQTVRIAPP